MRADGDPKRVVDAYLLDVAARQEADARGVAAKQPPPAPGDPPEDMTTAPEGRWGSREAEITRVEMRHANGAAGHGVPVRRARGHRAWRAGRSTN